MKKSQILAALALAFALGVVAPATSTYAYVYQLDEKGAEQEITNSKLIDDLRDAQAEATKHKSADEYQNYKELYDLINGEAELTFTIAADKFSDDTGYTATKKTLETIETELKEWILEDFPANSIDASDYANSSFEDVLKVAKAQLAKLNDVEDKTEYELLKNSYNDTNLIYMTAQKTTIADMQTKLATNFKYKGQDDYMVTTFTKKDESGDLESVNFSGAVAYAEKQTGDYAYYNTLIGAVNHVDDVLKTKATGGEKYTVAQAEAALTALNNAIAGKTTPAEDGTGEGTNKPGDEAQDPNAPDTGILADAEANASTTVAMVAGIATALTAAGAGVVAYRNARRSTRK